MLLHFLILGLHAVDGETIAESGEESVQRVTEFFTAFINTTYLIPDRNVLHTDRAETGRYSSGGRGYVAGLATILRSQGGNASLADYACTLPLKYSPKEGPIIAVIKRGHCTFDKKVFHAASMGAVGVLIYDNLEDSKLKTIQVSEGSIPSVFTYSWKGAELVQLLEREGRTVFLSFEEGSHCSFQDNKGELYCSTSSSWVPRDRTYNHLDPFDVVRESPATFGKSSVVFVSVSFLVLMLISMAWLLFYYVQRFRFIRNKDELERRLGRQAKQALSCVALVVVTATEEAAECTVCLEELAQGQEARRLPCAHSFHRACIDSWLLAKRKCPLCNLNIVKHFGLAERSGSQVDIDSEVEEEEVTSPTASTIM